VITLGASLGKQVIAEGVETEAQLERLHQLGCSHCQGFLLAEPLSSRQASALIEGLPEQKQGAGSAGPDLLFSAEREVKRLLRIH
jgi:EAL domain-containing protein (putative c-di-GMP-specific phosphodiesterase class I)